ncbi:MAG TPA: hypothetical protein VE993_14230 [Stellaceae bacterium]|nr:hypothetical protein [Stellaceae bacterium]
MAPFDRIAAQARTPDAAFAEMRESYADERLAFRRRPSTRCVGDRRSFEPSAHQQRICASSAE